MEMKYLSKNIDMLTEKQKFLTMLLKILNYFSKVPLGIKSHEDIL